MNMKNKYNNKLLNALYSLRSGAQLVANSICAFIGTFIFAGVFASFMFASSAVWAQGTPPAGTANCTVTAMNRTAPLQGDYGFTIYNIPGAAAFLGPGTPTPVAPFRVRAACSDGTVGGTNLLV